MNRPSPRKSSLTGSSPIVPPVSPMPAVAAAPETAVFEHAQPAAAKVEPNSSSTKPVTKSKYPPKVSFYQDPQDTARVRGAILHTQVAEGSRSLSQFIHQAVMDKVETLEAKYNNGQPFPAIGARELPQGRPMGE